MPQRLITVLTAGARGGRWQYDGPVDNYTRYLLRTHTGAERRYTATEALEYLRGRNVGKTTPLTLEPGRPRLPDEVRHLLVNPGLGDQMRLAILTAMDAAGIGVTQLAQRTGRDRGGIRDALTMGRTGNLSTKTAEILMAGAGGSWRVSYAPPAGPVDGIPPAAGPEPVFLRRVRAAATADHDRIVSWRDPVAVRHVRHPRAVFTLERARATHRVMAPVLEAWLTGLRDELAFREAAAATRSP